MFRTTWCSHKVGADGRRRLVLFASKLAACAGMHPYQDQAGMRLEFKHARGDVGDAMDGYVPPAAAASRALAMLAPELREKVDRAVAVRYEDASAVVRAEAEVRRLLEAAGATDAADVVRTALFTTHGSRCEAGVREAAVDAEGGRVRNIVTDGRFRVTAAPWLTVGDVDVYLGGKHDGIENQRVIEIKTRQRRFLGAPLYERVQTHAYMQVYGMRSASLIESYLGEQREHDMPFDDVMWAEVYTETAKFVESLDVG